MREWLLRLSVGLASMCAALVPAASALTQSDAPARRHEPTPAAATQPVKVQPPAPAVPAPQLAAPPKAATRPPFPSVAGTPKATVPPDPAAQSRRAARLAGIKSWGIQLQELDPASAGKAPFDMLVVDGTTGARSGTALTAADVAALKRRPGAAPRMLVSYLSIGEAEDYRNDYFNAEYMTEDAPDWLLSENERWKGNRRIRFCEEGWQRTILGDDDGHNVYNSVELSPLYRLIEAGFDGVYLDRVDVYSEVEKQCPDAARQMVAFVARLAAHARKKNPDFIVILQNAEELLRHPDMVASIDAVAKEDLFYGANHTEAANSPVMVKDTVANLALARKAGRPVFILDYLSDPVRRAADRSKIEAQGFIPYFGPRKLDRIWLQENLR